MSTSWTPWLRCLFALSTAMALSGAPVWAAVPDWRTDPDALPLAPAGALRFPRRYPSLDLGVGIRHLNPDLSGLAEVYGGTPSFRLSPIICGVVEIALSDVVALQLDAGASLAGGESTGYQGLAGIMFQPRLFPDPDLRVGLGGGVAVCWFHGESSGITTEAGATGYYLCAGLERRLDADSAVELYGGYSSYPRVSTDYASASDPESALIPASVDFSQAVVGLRLKVLVWER